MNNIIIGTAGHVDHGKTTLIMALTGIDADRLKEEKERGITIELGFAYLTLPNGERCGIIDVPGHEKFVRNMLAGAGSVDLAMFVVAGDEGMMPQSREHLEILTLLGIKRGIIVVTKTDILEDDWLEMVTLDIRDEVKGTFLENAQIIPVSARSGAGIEVLKHALFDMIEQSATSPRDHAPFRLPVDRVFSKDGFGTVVTGTLTDGELSVGDEIMLYPAMKEARVRNIQVHSKPVTNAKRGQRVAANLGGLKVEDIHKGCVLAKVGSIKGSDILDVRLDASAATKREIRSGSKVHLHYGTDDVIAKVVLFGTDTLKAGQTAYAQLRTESEVSARAGDRFVVRFYSPMETIGGGIILDTNPPKRSKSDNEFVSRIFAAKEKGTLKERISAFVEDRSKALPKQSELKINPFLGDIDFDSALTQLINEREVFALRDSVVHKNYIAHLSQKAKAILAAFHKTNPLLYGIKKEELRSKLLPRAATTFFDEIMAILQNKGDITTQNGLIKDASFKIQMNQSHQKMSSEITSAVLAAGFSTPSLDELAAKYPKEPKAFKQTIDALVASGEITMLTSQITIHKDNLTKAIQTIKTLPTQFTLAEFRDKLATSRKYAVAILEYLDAKGVTRKRGDFREIVE